MKLLIVDDESAITRLLSMAASQHNVKTASSGSEALVHLSAEHFDLMITDLNMPGMSGLELTREALQLFPSLKVIICTGSRAAEEMDQAQIMAHRVITKPFSPLEVIRVAEALLLSTE